jgi:hypothetical protein
MAAMRHIYKTILICSLIVATYKLALIGTTFGQGATNTSSSPGTVTLASPLTPTAVLFPTATPVVGVTNAIPSPPAQLSAWLGLVGGIIGIVAGFVTFILAWRNRRRIEFRVITAVVYWGEWTQSDIENSGPWPGMPGASASYKSGDCRRVFKVLEFLIRNEYPTEISVGRFMIDEWVYADHHEPGMTKWKRDYRVFNLYTHESTALDVYTRIPPHSSYGLRVEILEEANGPAYEGSHTRYVLSIPKSSVIEFYTDDGRLKKSVQYSGPIRVMLWNDQQIYDVYHLSNLLPPNAQFDWLPRPQGIQYPSQEQRHIFHEAQRWINAKYCLCVYGTQYHTPGQFNRLAKAWKGKRKQDTSDTRDSGPRG